MSTTTVNTSAATEFANSQGLLLKQYTLELFVDAIHKRFYQVVAISFKDYFLEILGKDGQFIVPQTKLIEYGVVSNDKPATLKSKLDSMNLIDGIDYQMQTNPKSSGKPVKMYVLTPESFKLCLMRAQRRSTQSVDVGVYSQWLIMLMKMVDLFYVYREAKHCAIARANTIIVNTLKRREARACKFIAAVERECDNAYLTLENLQEQVCSLEGDNGDYCEEIKDLKEELEGSYDVLELVTEERNALRAKLAALEAPAALAE